MIAGALLGNPVLLIADEPTSALDVTVQADLLNLLSELRKEQGLAMLLVSHNLAVVSQIAERTVVMYSGEIIEEGPTSTLINSAKHPYTVNLIRSMQWINRGR
jgi:ABC-type dipeptide/oligopeptide/nickel transport system ATPase component